MTPRIHVFSVRQHKNNLSVRLFPAFFTSGFQLFLEKKPNCYFPSQMVGAVTGATVWRLGCWFEVTWCHRKRVTVMHVCVCLFRETVLKRHGCSEVLCPRGANIRSNKSFEHRGTCWIRVSALPQVELVCLVGPDPDVLWFEGAETVWSRCRLVSAVHSFWRHFWSFCTRLFMTLRTPLCVEWMRVYDFLWRLNEESGFPANSDGKEAAPIFAGLDEKKFRKL